MVSENSDRRGFVRRIVKIAALGGLGALVLGEHPEKVDAEIGPAGISIAGVTSGVVGAFIGVDNNNSVTDDYGVVTGGQNNMAGDSAGNTSDHPYATVGGGTTNTASGYEATVGGGGSNTASGFGATVGGGQGNTASGWGAFVGGGGYDGTTLAGNQAGGKTATIGGGLGNTASDYATVGGGQGNQASNQYSTVGGGNLNTTSGDTSTVGGGESNQASSWYSTVGGGYSNTSSSYRSTVGGGYVNTASGFTSTVGGGAHNQASSDFSAVGGGYMNTASGNNSTVPGGLSNTAAGDYSLAAGRRSKIDVGHAGAFLFADSTDADFNSVAANEFAVRCTGGARFITAIDDSGIPTSQVTIDNNARLGIGTTTPSSKLHVESALDTVGTVFELPSHPGIPPGGDPAYRQKAVMQWEGGEAKFGKWRQYFNAFEQDWALAYNAPWDYTNNQWLGRDSGDPRANICACMRFDVAEGNSGENVFEVWFAPPAPAGTVPDWNAASMYTFYDGRNPTIGTPKAARLRINGAASMESILSLSSHSTVNPFVVNLISDGLNNNFRIRNALTNVDYLTILRDSGNVGIGTTAPARMLHIQGNNAVARLDRDVDSASFILVRTAAGDYSTVWKSFTFGVKASGVNNGSFFIGDMGTNVAGSSQNRLLIDTAGNVGIGTTTPSSKLHVAGRVKAQGYDTGDITFANGVQATEEGEGLAFLNRQGRKIAVLDSQGNLQVKGKITENPDL